MSGFFLDALQQMLYHCNMDIETKSPGVRISVVANMCLNAVKDMQGTPKTMYASMAIIDSFEKDFPARARELGIVKIEGVQENEAR